MERFTSPLDNLRVASPCPANWDVMYGNERKRFCASCKLNVYNLSAMTKADAERFLINSEGRVCVRYYRRADGTILTQNCPVGWRAVKQRVSRVATAAFSLVAGFFGGLFAYNFLRPQPQPMIMGAIAIDSPPVQGKPMSLPHQTEVPVVGLVEERGGAVVGEPVPAYVVGRRVSPTQSMTKRPPNRSYSDR